MRVVTHVHTQTLSLPKLVGNGQRRWLLRTRPVSMAAQVLPMVRATGRVAASAEASKTAAARRGASMSVVCGFFGILCNGCDEARSGRVDTGSEELRTTHRGFLYTGR